MQRHKIATQAQGVAGFKDMCTLLDVGVDPLSTFQEYSEVVGTDLTGAPIEAGLPQATWSWDVMTQTDFQRLLDYVSSGASAYVYIRTRNNTGASGLDFNNYLCVMARPQFSEREGLIVRGITVNFTAMVVQ